MAKLNAEALFKKFEEIKAENGTYSVASILKESATSDDNTIIDGKIDIDTVTKISAKIEALIAKFKEQSEFNWRVHVLDPVSTIISVISEIGDYSDRQYIEKLIVEILKDLYKQHTPKIPYIPAFITKWILGMIASTLIPWLVDWMLDLIYGEDELEENK